MSSLAPQIPLTKAVVRPPLAGDSLDTIAFGEWLRSARERSGVTLEQIARETKIRPLHLDALEHGRLAELPAGAYRRGETIAYAKAIGMDPRVALQHLEDALRASQPAAAPEPVSAEPSRAGRRSARLSLFLLAVSFAGLVMWMRTTPTSAPNAAQPAAADPAPEAVARAVESSPAAPVAVSRATNDRPARAEAAERRAPTAPIASTAPPAALEAAPPAQAGPGRLTIITDPPGARVTLNGIGRGATPLTLSDLSAGAVRIRVTKDGRTAQQRDVQFTGRSMTVTIALPELDR
jgi:transcriptional regulator with XRE-family HTH domain